MPTMDATAKAALELPVIAPAWFIYLDVLDDPIRATTHVANIIPTGTGDAELDSQEFIAVNPRVIEVGDVGQSDGGSDTLSVALSGVVTMDTALLEGIGDRAKWWGRVCRLWFRLYDETGVTAQGAFVPYYTGYMSAVKIHPSPESQIIKLEVENYLAAFNQASNRSYLNQKDYDSGDLSAAATISAANGAKHNIGNLPAGWTTGGSGGFFGGLAGVPGVTFIQRT